MNQQDRRLEVIRQYLLDVEMHRGSLLETSDACSYLRWNFEQYIKGVYDQHDQARRVQRIPKSQQEFGDYVLSELETKTVDLTIGKMGKIIRDPAYFGRWIYLAFVSPILAEENRYLDRSDPKEIWTVGGIRGTVHHSSNKFLFKVWEAVLFPHAKDVPPRFEPSPDEVTPPAGRLE